VIVESHISSDVLGSLTVKIDYGLESRNELVLKFLKLDRDTCVEGIQLVAVENLSLAEFFVSEPYHRGKEFFESS